MLTVHSHYYFHACRYDVVAGLVQREVAPPGSTVPKLLPCIGDEALLDDRTGVMCLPAAPRLASAFTLRIGLFVCVLYGVLRM